MEKNILFFCGVVSFESKEQGIYILDEDDIIPGTLCGIDIYRTCCNGALFDMVEHLDLIVQEKKRKQLLTQIISIGYIITKEHIISNEIYAYTSVNLLTRKQLQKELDSEDKNLIKRLTKYFGLKKVEDIFFELQMVGEDLMKAMFKKTKQHQYN